MKIKSKIKSKPISKMSINNLNIKSHRKRLRKYLLGGGERTRYTALMKAYEYSFNYKTGRFLEYGGTKITLKGRQRKSTEGFLKDGVLYEEDYWTDLEDKFNDINNFENYEVNIDFSNYPISKREIFSIMGNRFNGKNIFVEMGTKGYTLTTQGYGRFIDYFNNGDVEVLTESDSQYLSSLSGGNVSFSNMGVGKSASNPGFFPFYLNNKNINLKRYAIYHDKNSSNYKHNCLIKALIKSKKCDKEKLTTLIDSRFIKTRNIPKNKLPFICSKLNIKLRITEYLPKKEGQNKHSKTTMYGEGNIIIDLGVIEQHYFLKEKSNYTWFSIENYDRVKDYDKWNEITALIKNKDGSFYAKRNKEKFKNSYELIKNLVREKEKYLTEICVDDKMIISPFYEEVKNKTFYSLNYDEDELKETPEYEERPDKYKFKIENTFFGDFEAGFNDKSHHLPYLNCIRRYKKFNPNENLLNPHGRTFYDSNKISSAKRMLNYVISETDKKEQKLIFFHNLKYDYQFICKVKDLIITSVIKPNNREININCIYKKHKITFRDSASMIANSLKCFGGMFGLEQEKEVMPYNIYTIENIKKQFIDIEEIKLVKDFEKFTCDPTKNRVVDKVFDQEKWEHFLKNAKKWNCIKNNKINIIKYSKIYCLMDCKVLNDGYDIFRRWILELTGIDILQEITISSVADKYVIKEGAYQGVYQLSGIPRIFIQRCLVGGKTMTCRNEKHIDFSFKKNADLDINSSYPFSYVRIKGLLLGKPKVIPENWTYDDIKDKDGYFVKIKIKKLKAFDYPLLSYKNEKGIRTWSNNIKDLNDNGVYIGKFALEDAIHFGNMEFEIEQGYYFDEGRNKKLPDLTNYLYEERKKLKKQRNKAEQIYKLILNSIFGKTALKAFDCELIIKNTEKFIGKANNWEDVKKYYITKKTKIFNEELYNQDLGFMTLKIDARGVGYCYINEAKKFIRRNYNNIKEWDIRGKYYFIKKNYNVGEHKNRVHIAVEILDMSKRTLNEVLCMAYDSKIKVGIIDTDSVQLAKKDVPTIIKLFENEFGKNPNYYLHKEFFGKKLGMWDNDFKMSGSNDLDDIINMKKCVKSHIDSIGAIYLAKKMYIHHLKATNGQEAYHIRMKGVPTRAIYYYCYLNNTNPFDIYKELYNGESINFDLTCGGYFQKFEYDAKLELCKFRNNFTREISVI